VCSVGLDHRDYLGDTLDLIGVEKAGIFRSDRPAVLGTDDMPQSVYATIAAIKAIPLVAGKDFTWRVEESPTGQTSARWSYNGLRSSLRNLPPSALSGSIQYRNAATALAAIEALEASAPATAGRRSLKKLRLNAHTIGEALRSVRLPGRFQIVQAASVEWILDIAHNEPAAAIFARHVRERPMPGSEPSASPTHSGKGRTFAVVGILGDKDAYAIASSLEPLVDHWIVCALPGPRGTSAEVLAQRLRLPTSKVTLAATVEAGCEIAGASAGPGDRVLVFGSFYTVGPALQWLGI